MRVREKREAQHRSAPARRNYSSVPVRRRRAAEGERVGNRADVQMSSSLCGSAAAPLCHGAPVCAIAAGWEGRCSLCWARVVFASHVRDRSYAAVAAAHAFRGASSSSSSSA